jgi:hypothetical protein
MKITAVTLFFAVFSLCMMYLIVLRIKQEKIGIRSALVWFFLWAGIGFFSLFPQLLDWAARVAQMESRIIFVLLFAVFVLFAIIFNIATRLEKMQRNIERLSQEIALMNFKIDMDDKEKNRNP